MQENMEEVLKDLRRCLEADKFQLKLDSVGADGTVTVVIEALEGACLDCLLPDEMLTNMIEMEIRRVNPEFRVNLIKRVEAAH